MHGALHGDGDGALPIVDRFKFVERVIARR